MQQGFGFEVCDAQGNEPPFLWRHDDVIAAIDKIRQVKWVATDSEGTGLTDASMPVALGTAEIKQGASNVLRMRTIQIRIPTINGRRGPRLNMVFDCDKMGPALTQQVCEAVLSRELYIAHNAGFDLYWHRLAEGRKTMPRLVADTMLLVRALAPQLVLKRAEMVEGVRDSTQAHALTEPKRAAWQSLVKGGSGGSLADVVLSMFNVVVDKTYQKPGNWTGLLGFAHYDYAMDDAVWADKMLCQLLGIDDEGDLYQAYLGARARKSVVRLIEPQVPELVYLRETGMPASTTVAYNYVRRKRKELAKKVDELIVLEPGLEPHRARLADPDAGLDDSLKDALAIAFQERGVQLRKTAAKGSAQVGEKDLRACRAAQIEESRPLFNAWVAVCRSKKASSMALEVAGFIERGPDGRLRALLSHGPVTGRLAASEPNCFTGDTEILTPQGWTRFDALRDEQLVAQYHQGQISFTAPTAHIREHWKGELIHNQTSRIDLLTTPKHRCLLINRNTGAEEVMDAQHYKEDHLQLHAATYAGGPGLALSEQEIRFIVMMQADGSWHDGGVDIKFTKQRKIDRLRELFGDEVGHSYDTKFGQTRFRFNKGNRLVQAAKSFLGQEKLFGDWIFQLSRQQLDVFVDELAYWDGLFTRKDVSIAYTTTVEQNAHWVQTAYALSGKTVRVVPYMAANSKKQAWRVQGFHRAFTYTTNRTQTRQSHDGLVHCVSVDSGFIVVRRNGKVAITGQCQQWPRDQLFRAICVSNTRDGCEDATVIITEANLKFMNDVMDAELAVGETVTVNSAWLAAMFYSTKLLEAMPKDEFEAFKASIDGLFTHVIVASDFGALDVRVGAALCVRSQREMIAAVKGVLVPGPVQPSDDIMAVLRKVVPLMDEADAVDKLGEAKTRYFKEMERLEKRLESLKEDLDADRIPRKQFFTRRSELKEQLLAVKMGWRLSECLELGARRGEREYSALRDAFVADIDIHTFTGMKLVGRDPMAEFSGLSVPDRKALEKKLKKELGPRRQQGKIANLSLLYGMADAGFQEAAARNYDEHWTMQESHDIRALWMNAYPEVELWHLWTECLQVGTVYVPDQTKENQKAVRTGWWLARTLAGREIVATGLNAALSYQDQSSGADILGNINHRLMLDHERIFFCSINQVHDEQVFALPVETAEADLAIIEEVMVGEANKLTMPYGVPCAVSPACGPIWVKD